MWMLRLGSENGGERRAGHFGLKCSYKRDLPDGGHLQRPKVIEKVWLKPDWHVLVSFPFVLAFSWILVTSSSAVSPVVT